MHILSDSNYLQVRNEAKSTLQIVIFIYFKRCKQSLDLISLINEIEDNWEDKIKFYKVSIKENPQVKSWLNNPSAPQLFLFANGNVKQTIPVGDVSKTELLEWIKPRKKRKAK